MLIELAHYTIIFALTAVGLQTFLLAPTLWSGGSAVAIKLGFRGACFTSALLVFAFAVLLHGFAVHDFSLAVVFETFDSRSGAFYALQAFCSSREGFFFTFIVILSVFSLLGFSRKDLATYQERGRYLFATEFLIFFLLSLMLATANPFVRIEEPPFEGVGFNPDWRPLHKISELLLLYASYAVLSISFIKMICMYSKGRQFVAPALRGSLLGLICLIAAAGSKLMTGFVTAENGVLWQWTPDNSLLAAVFLLTTGQVVLLFFRRQSRVFTNWIVFFAGAGLAFFSAVFFAAEYKLFAMAPDEVYFPNPVAALSAFAGVACFLMFLSSIMAKQSVSESGFSVFSRESFAGLAVAALLAAGVSIGTLSLLPTLFMFLPDLPLRLLPALFKNILIATGVIFTLFFFSAFKRSSKASEQIKGKLKTEACFWGLFLILALVCRTKVNHGQSIILCVLPSVLFLNAFWTTRTVKIPSSFDEAKKTLTSTKAFTYGTFFITLGLFVFSFSFSFCLLNGGSASETVEISEHPEHLPCRIISKKDGGGTPLYELVCPDKKIKGNLIFQWPDKKLNVRLFRSERFALRLIEAVQKHERELTVKIKDYPLLPLTADGLFLICLGLFFLIFSDGKERSI